MEFTLNEEQTRIQQIARKFSCEDLGSGGRRA